MDFNDTAEEATYRAEVRAWLEAHAPRKRGAGALEDEDAEGMQAARDWQRRKAEAGYACITWPKEWGGGGGASWQSVIFGQEESKVSTPPNPFAIGLGMCVPTVMAFAGDETKKRFVGPALRGEEIWCQLFSEPSGVSDVAAAFLACQALAAFSPLASSSPIMPPPPARLGALSCSQARTLARYSASWGVSLKSMTGFLWS